MYIFNTIQLVAFRRFCLRGMVGLLVVTMLFATMPIPKAEAQVPFGGLSLSVVWCPCSFNLWIKVGPPRPGSFVFQPGASMLYLFGQIYRPGVWLLGLAAPTPVPCMVFVPFSCASIGGGLPIQIVGTSM